MEFERVSKAELVRDVHDIVGGSRADIEFIYSTLADVIISYLNQGIAVHLQNIGTIKVVDREFELDKINALHGKKERTGKKAWRKVVRFMASRKLKDIINNK